MKKVFLILPVILLVAAGCSFSQSTVQNSVPTPAQTNQSGNNQAQQVAVNSQQKHISSGGLIPALNMTIEMPNGLKLSEDGDSGISFESSYGFTPVPTSTENAVFLYRLFVSNEQQVRDLDKIIKETSGNGQMTSSEIDDFIAQKKALEQNESIDNLTIKTFNGRTYLVGDAKATSDTGYFRNYTTFINNKRVVVSVWMLSKTKTQKQINEADKLFEQVKFK